jgi:sphingomyelin phosphodiesterase
MFLNKYTAMMILRCFYICIVFQWSNALPIAKREIPVNELSSCELCNFLLPVAKELIALNDSSLIEKLGITLCQHLHLADDAVCAGMIDEYNDVVIEVLRYSPLSTHEICGVAFNCMRQADIPALKWNVTFPTPIQQLSTNPSSFVNTLSILHLADLHLDTEYKPGSNANCGRPVCCRDGTPKSGEIGAGFWGDYRTCDIPQWTAESILKYIIQTEEQIDWIYFTGDIAPHDVWQQTQSKDLDEISLTTRLLKQTFSNKKIYPCVGNHESAPPDLFSTNNMSWLYLTLANQWIDQFGLDERTRDTIIQGGYYTTIIAPNIRLISLNMNYCSESNFWLFINSTDPLGQLEWLIRWLEYAEKHQEKVHIIGHHPPRMCMVSFSWAYSSIVHRYQNTITGQFFSHTHNDEFMLFYNETNSVSFFFIQIFLYFSFIFKGFDCIHFTFIYNVSEPESRLSSIYNRCET